MPSASQPLSASLERIVQRFQQISEPKRRYEYLLWFSKRLPPFPDEQKVAEHKVSGCVSQVYVTTSLEQGKVSFQGDSDFKRCNRKHWSIIWLRRVRRIKKCDLI